MWAETGLAVTDGAGEQYEIVGLQMLWTLRKVDDGSYVQVGESTMADLIPKQEALRAVARAA